LILVEADYQKKHQYRFKMATEAIKEVPKQSGFIALSDKQEINWYHTGMLVMSPLLALVGVFTTPLRLPTLIFAVIMYFWTGLGITAGYHRLWSHRAYSARFPVRLALCLGGAAAFEGSCKWWCRNHRAHHRYTDTDKDPYNARRGFFYAHLGWMLVKQNANQIGFADITDLQRDPMIEWQHRYYGQIALITGIVFPTLFAGLWGDMLGGYFYASMMRIVFVHHATFFVNSLAHTLGEKTFSDHHTAFDSVVTAVLTLGEGYHNYHHEFPQDYRNGIKAYHYDPTKWLIAGLSFFKLTYNLKTITDPEINKARLQMQQRQVDSQKAKLQYGKRYDVLPEMSWNDFQQKVSRGAALVVIEGIVHDVKNFVHEHPGGRQTLLNYIGTDATNVFNGKGSDHSHSPAARKYLYAMRIGKIGQKDIGA
jgi:stearoyl-CoA desaturase (delta-9 desaturase)